MSLSDKGVNMENNRSLGWLLGFATTTLSCIALTEQTRLPGLLSGTLHNGWQYAIDASYDSYGTANGVENRLTTTAGTLYEIQGIAIKEDPATNRIWVGINANLLLIGNNTSPILTAEGRTFNLRNDSIAWGDLFFDFSGTGNFKVARDAGKLFGVRFAPNNDSGISTGVYRTMTDLKVSGQNAVSQMLDPDEVWGRDRGHSGTRAVWIGDPWNDSDADAVIRFENWATGSHWMPHIIDSGAERIGDITLHNQAGLMEQGFDPSFFFEQGDNIFGFSFQKPPEFSGNFIATLLQDRINGEIAFFGQLTSAPPSEDNYPVTLAHSLTAVWPETAGGWSVPPAHTGFVMETLDGSKFTRIPNVPCGVYKDDVFSAIAADGATQVKLDGLTHQDNVDFVELFGQGVEKLIVLGEVDLNNPPVFPAQFALEFNSDIISFRMRPIELAELESVMGLLTLGAAGTASKSSYPETTYYEAQEQTIFAHTLDYQKRDATTILSV